MNFKIVSHHSLRMISIIVLMLSFSGASGQKAVFQIENIFPFGGHHVHGSTIIELPNGDLLAGWFQGSGERTADDVQIMGARKKSGKKEWSQPFLLADTKGFPDCNPILFLDSKNRLWLMWYAVLAHQWETSLIKYRISEDYLNMTDAPKWVWQADLHVKAGDYAGRGIQPDDSFVTSVKDQLEEYGKYIRSSSGQAFNTGQWDRYVERQLSKARGDDMIRGTKIFRDSERTDEIRLGFPYFRRMGWQTQNKPAITATGRIVVPLYSDGFGFSLVAYTDDDGESWAFSDPLVGRGNIQPAIAQTRSGELVAYMRDNGPRPKRLHVSRSGDNGKTWSSVQDSTIPNPGSGADIVTLKNGNWALIYNDTEVGRPKLSVALSEDEGKTWSWHKRIEDGEEPSMAHYPAIVEGRNGLLHISYSYCIDKNAKPKEKTIKYAVINEAWIKSK